VNIKIRHPKSRGITVGNIKTILVRSIPAVIAVGMAMQKQSKKKAYKKS